MEFALFGLEVSAFALALVLVAALVGGLAQSLLGFGAAFTTVPALAVVAPQLLPGSVLVGILPLSVVMYLQARDDVDVRAVGRLSIGRLPGILVGAAIVAWLPTRSLTIAIAALLLVAVAALAAGAELAVTAPREMVAGFVSGVTGTAAALGGPPLALLYRGSASSYLRPTLAAVWAVGLVPILVSLRVAGEFTLQQAQAGTVLAVVMLLGLAVAGPVLGRVEESTLRLGILWWAGLGGILAAGRAMIG